MGHKRTNRRQIRILLEYGKEHTQEVAAAKAGVSLRTARKYLKSGGGMNDNKVRSWRTRRDDFAEVWTDIETLLLRESELQSQTIMQWLIDRDGETFNWSQLRTLQRRVSDWKASHGPDIEVIFRQNLVPGRQSQSDWTHCDELEVTIAGQPFPHRLFHFMLPYSRWETAYISNSESFENLTCGYMRAAAELGRVPGEHRTDNLTAAVNNHGNRHVFNERWECFLRHYDVVPSKNNPGQSHENGSVEKSHDLLKNALKQALKLRGSKNFASVAEYERFIRRILDQRNKRRKQRLAEEMVVMKPLPERDWNDPIEEVTTVTSFSTIVIDEATYSVPARLIGRKLRALLYPETIRFFLNSTRTLVLELPRVRPGERKINYRHMIAQLARKPAAFAGYIYREEMFPSLAFRRAYDALKAWNGKKADQEYLWILHHAAMHSERDVEAALELLLEAGRIPFLDSVKELVETKLSDIPNVRIPAPDLCSYDQLLTYMSSARKEK